MTQNIHAAEQLLQQLRQSRRDIARIRVDLHLFSTEPVVINETARHRPPAHVDIEEPQATPVPSPPVQKVVSTDENEQSKAKEANDAVSSPRERRVPAAWPPPVTRSADALPVETSQPEPMDDPVSEAEPSMETEAATVAIEAVTADDTAHETSETPLQATPSESEPTASIPPDGASSEPPAYQTPEVRKSTPITLEELIHDALPRTASPSASESSASQPTAAEPTSQPPAVALDAEPDTPLATPTDESQAQHHESEEAPTTAVTPVTPDPTEWSPLDAPDANASLRRSPPAPSPAAGAIENEPQSHEEAFAIIETSAATERAPAAPAAIQILGVGHAKTLMPALALDGEDDDDEDSEETEVAGLQLSFFEPDSHDLSDPSPLHLDDQAPVEPPPQPRVQPSSEEDLSDPVTASRFRQLAEAAAANGDTDAVITAWSDLIDSDPDAFDAYINRGCARLSQGDLAGAASDFRRARTLRPDSAAPMVHLGRVHMSRDTPENALAQFQQAIDTDADYAPGWFQRGLAHYQLQDFSAAVSDLEHAAKLDPDLPGLRAAVQRAIRSLRDA